MVKTISINDARLLTNKQKRALFARLYFNTQSKTFGNAYRSALASGFKDSYARNIMALNQQWLAEQRRKALADLTPDHIVSGIQSIAQSASYDRDRLRAFELLGKLQGMFVERTVSDVNVQFTNAVPRPAIASQLKPDMLLSPSNTTIVEQNHSTVDAPRNPQALGTLKPSGVTSDIQPKTGHMSNTEKPVVENPQVTKPVSDAAPFGTVIAKGTTPIQVEAILDPGVPVPIKTDGLNSDNEVVQ
jgi:hypothetical protein